MNIRMGRRLKCAGRVSMDGILAFVPVWIADELTEAPVWESANGELCFITELDSNYGLIGMDVIKQWKEFKLERGGMVGGF
jgi:hypothetical protein